MNASTYLQICAEAERLQKRKAILRKWSRVLKKSQQLWIEAYLKHSKEPNRWQAAQQAGVVATMRKDWLNANIWLTTAKRDCPTLEGLAHINRDLSKTRGLCGQFEEATKLINQSLDFFGNRENSPVPGKESGWAACLYFKARIQMWQQNRDQAWRLYRKAMYQLRLVLKQRIDSGSEPEIREAKELLLYCLLQATFCAALAGKSSDARRWALETKALAREVGSKQQQIAWLFFWPTANLSLLYRLWLKLTVG